MVSPLKKSTHESFGDFGKKIVLTKIEVNRDTFESLESSEHLSINDEVEYERYMKGTSTSFVLAEVRGNRFVIISRRAVLSKAVQVRSQLHHMIKKSHLRDIWLAKISKSFGASSICNILKFGLQEKLDNVNIYKLLRPDFPKKVLR